MYSKLKLINDPYPKFINEFVNYCGYEFNEEFKKRRFIELVALRTVIMQYLRSQGLALTKIAYYFNCKHPVVIHNVKKDSKYDVNMLRYENKLKDFLEVKNGWIS